MIKRNQQLTTGALLRYLCGNTSERAILQVVDIKVIEKIKNGDVVMGGVSDNTEKTDTLVTDSDAQCTLIGSVSLMH